MHIVTMDIFKDFLSDRATNSRREENTDTH